MKMNPVSYTWVLFVFIPIIPYIKAHQQVCFQKPCVSINECPSLSNTYRAAKGGSSNAIQKLRSLVCSQENGRVNVCCQPESGFPDYCGGENKPERIVGGEKAAIKQWPWMAVLRASAVNGAILTPWVCGGVLISSRYVLTAAHCVEDPNFKVNSVRLGELILNKEVDSPDFMEHRPQDIDIEDIIPHPKYQVDCPKCNDIALIKLADPARVDREFVEPICISQSPSENIDNSAFRNGWVAGWGLTEGNPYFVSQANHLQQLSVPIQELKFCRERKQGGGYPDHDMIFCAGGEEGKDTCRGDSGGPLMVATEDNVWYTIGIVSFGNTFCGTKGSQTVFTSISYYVKWIEQNML